MWQKEVGFLVTPLITVSLVVSSAYSQQITVQQPVISTFSTQTGVSVLDCGSAFIAGVKRAGETRSSYDVGPFRFGSSVGMFREHSGLSARVWIHDMSTIDQFLLNSAPIASGQHSLSALSGNAGQAYSSLVARHSSPTVRTSMRRRGVHISVSRFDGLRGRSRQVEPIDRVGSSSVATTERGSRAHRYFQLGVKAQQCKKNELARLHFRMASKYGSARARTRLAEVSPMDTVRR